MIHAIILTKTSLHQISARICSCFIKLVRYIQVLGYFAIAQCNTLEKLGQAALRNSGSSPELGRICFVYLLFLFSCTACASGSEQTDNQIAQDTIQQTIGTSADTLVLSKEALLGQINPEQHKGFTRIASKYTDKQGIYLRKETYEAFERMAAAAKKEGIDLQIVSATRNFNVQKSIWEAKWNGEREVDGQNISKTIPDPKQRALKILEYSSMPGSSRHHWGTDMDLNALNNAYFDTGSGKKLYDWLQTHGAEYGFCQVYTTQSPDRPNGYHEERWHWSYMPLASQFLQQYGQKVTHADIKGFAGAESAPLIEIIPNYVMGIAPDCKNWKQ